jgi:DNA-binding HxlR family transcriptional regulator
VRSDCPIATSLELLGDRWSLVIVRDLMFSTKRRYNELLESPEGITTSILASRLKQLEADGIVQRTAYQERPTRYEYSLTEKGLDLFDVLAALIRWGGVHVPEATVIPEEGIAEMDPRER